jgi:hypothetical protein
MVELHGQKINDENITAFRLKTVVIRYCPTSVAPLVKEKVSPLGFIVFLSVILGAEFSRNPRRSAGVWNPACRCNPWLVFGTRQVLERH